MLKNCFKINNVNPPYSQKNIWGGQVSPSSMSYVKTKISKNKSSAQNRQILDLESKYSHVDRSSLLDPGSPQKINLKKKYIPNRLDKQLKIDDFLIIKKLGSGNCGEVCLVKHKKTGFICAMKSIEKTFINSKPKSLELLILELKIQSFLTHPNIIQLFGFFDNKNTFFILLQLASHGSLYEIMKKKMQKKQNLQETTYTNTALQNQKVSIRLFHQQTISVIIRDLLNCCIYMQRKNIMHRDLKPQNIVVCHGNVKICDFGLATYFSSKQQNFYRQTICGTPLYFSPEIILGKRYNYKADIWALGVLAYQLFTGTDPFKVVENQDLSRILSEQIQLQNGSIEFSLFLSHTLEKNPNCRFDGKLLRQHEFIKKYEKLQTIEELCEAST